jgi:hypothetical protein
MQESSSGWLKYDPRAHAPAAHPVSHNMELLP